MANAIISLVAWIFYGEPARKIRDFTHEICIFFIGGEGLVTYEKTAPDQPIAPGAPAGRALDMSELPGTDACRLSFPPGACCILHLR